MKSIIRYIIANVTNVINVIKRALFIIAGGVGVITAIISGMLIKFWIITIIILSTLKLTGQVQIPWFAGISTISVVGTGLWVMCIGLLVWFIGVITVLFVFKRNYLH